jgi:hypothetical protein
VEPLDVGLVLGELSAIHAAARSALVKVVAQPRAPLGEEPAEVPEELHRGAHGVLAELVANPVAKASVEGRTAAYHARTLGPEDTARAWPKLDAVYPAFAQYRRRSVRTIPVVALTPVPGA